MIHFQIAKNVASDVAGKLCESVAAKLEGKVMGTFQVLNSTKMNILNLNTGLLVASLRYPLFQFKKMLTITRKKTHDQK
jgi:hypothetical protein